MSPLNGGKRVGLDIDFLPIGASDSDVVFYFGKASRAEWRFLALGCHGKKQAHTFGALAGFPAHAENAQEYLYRQGSNEGRDHCFGVAGRSGSPAQNSGTHRTAGSAAIREIHDR